MAEKRYLPLFETRPLKGRVLFRLFAASIMVGISFIFVYRVRFFPAGSGKLERWTWDGLFLAELWFSFYWVLTIFRRWNIVYRFPYKDRLIQRFERELPGIDIFVCTADSLIEPPSLVINTVLSVMAYDYSPEKLSVYLSDDGGSELMFYAMLEAANFSKKWLPFCKKFKVEQTSPEAYFMKAFQPTEVYDPVDVKDWVSVKIVIDGRNTNAVDIEGKPLPTLVYLAREKRPLYHHHFKAGAMNALLNFPGLDAIGGPLYIGSGCFHRREALLGKKYDKNCKVDWKSLDHRKVEESANVLEETCKILASCTFEQNTQWGKEMGLKYGCAVEDVITGLSIQCKGWKSIYLDPERQAFLGVAPTTLLQMLVQQKRWSEGHLQIFLSRSCSLLYGHKKIPLKLQLAYCSYNLWAANFLPTLYYVAVPCLCLLKGVSLLPKTSSPWVLPFAYVAFAHRAYSLGEFIRCGGTFRGWYNDQRIWLFKRTTSYLFAFFDTILKLLGYSKPAFVITAKAAEENVTERYEQELIEFGATSPMFDILATLAMLNIFSCFGAIKKVILDADHYSKVLNQFGLQILLCLVLVTINLPVYQALFFRKDNGRMPSSTTCKSIIFALLACTLAMH
ncbi:hypothetical protein DITRI_Ditri06bG0129600 [Diplodiscus trichospermus]